jgi:hypothetical protein
MDAATVITNIQNVTPGSHSELPKSEKVVRPLVSLSPEQQQTVWAEACKEANGHPTAEQVKTTVQKIIQPEDRKDRF